jgi:hypothetical protein
MQKRSAALLWALGLPLLQACSMSGDATSRQEQEEKFRTAFGISPASEVRDISYSWACGRGLMDGSQNEWMRFTYIPSLMSEIIDKKGFKEKSFFPAPFPNDPKWWNTPQPHAKIYVREAGDTPEDEGFQFREVLWADPTTGFAYYSRFCWD